MIDASGLRSAAATNGQVALPNGTPFATESGIDSKNIIFTSRWDNYLDSVIVPLTYRSSHAYFMLAGTKPD
ncbi:hypothetical protein [Pedobacter mucosus]|uniref:hypothetical protein n=1 Tax=Pedobacter mucosus TaxID=2895286 RepID=UPI001EE3C448|nr:hypothetical protein [Pedobacter mucosus]UKT62992.1 hypothetical protein LOK61_14595 [Pedobacter mucosus]